MPDGSPSVADCVSTGDQELRLDDFDIVRLTFEIEALTKISLPPYKGSALRGGLGTVFKNRVCANRNIACPVCILISVCPYPCCFESVRGSGNGNQLTGSLPYVLEPPVTERTEFPRGSHLEFGLSLFGRGIDYLPYFVFSFKELGKVGLGKGRGKYRLNQVSDSECGIVFDGGAMTQGPPARLSFDDICSSAKGYLDGFDDRVRIRFLTPARITKGDRVRETLDFAEFTESLARRVVSVYRGYCGGRADEEAILAQADGIRTAYSDLIWHDWRRYSSRQDDWMSLGGFIGEMVLEGDFSRIMPLLTLGEYLHVGKQTSFGLGKYEVERAGES